MWKRTLRPTDKVLPEDGRAHNRSMLLQHLFHEGPSSRADLARATGLTRVTISDLIASLMGEGLVAELGARPEGRVGKPAILVGVDTAAFQIIAVDLTDDELMLGAVLDLAGTILVRRSRALEGRTGDAAVDVLLSFCRELVGLATRTVLGVGVGSPGIIDADGTVVQAPNRDWDDVPLATTLRAGLDVPVHIANDANAGALGEFTYGGAPGEGLLVLTVGEGVGAGIVLDGSLVTGTGHAAGELGHVTVIDERDDVADAPLGRAELCACGRHGCLETILSVPALRRRVAGLDPAAADAALASVGRRLGIALAPVVSALNLAEVVLSGPPELLDGPLRTSALETLRERTIPVVGSGLQLRMTQLGEDGTLLGAAVLVLSSQLGFS